MATAAGALSAATWVYLLAGRGRFWHIDLEGDRQRAADSEPPVAVVIPARDEADVVRRAITSLLRQQYRSPIHIFLIDDASTDGTAEAARAAAAQLGRSQALTVLAGAPLPPGWSGKLWAMQQGIARAGELHPRYLLLTDADVVHGPDAVARLVAIAESGGYDLTSFMVKLHCRSGAEKLLIPAFVFFFFKLYPPAWIADPKRHTAGAAGGCMLLRPEALARAGGIESIRGEVIDDCALARAIKRKGGRVWLGATDASHSIRAYGSLAAIGHMIARTAFRQLNHSAWLLAGTVVGLAVTYVAPVALLFSRSALPMAFGAAAWAMMTAAYLPMTRFYGRRAWWALTLPAAAAFYMGATVWSAVQFWLGRGGEWKGRAQDRASLSR